MGLLQNKKRNRTMAKQTRDRQRLGSLKYFYYEGQLYQRIQINRPANIVYAKSVATGEMFTLSYTDYRRKRSKAFSTQEAAYILNRKPGRLYTYINLKRIEPPQRTSPDMGFNKIGAYYWSEDDILNLHEYLITVGSARITAHGLVVPPKNLPNRAEVKALMGSGTVLYVKTASGEFVPTWKEPNY